ncbi:MAG: hypothetical protein KJ915_08490 [Candidatus Omnitrophica bacterium]|nr:hypothetical protein [Candidatus Omnitrophota bacterium]
MIKIIYLKNISKLVVLCLFANMLLLLGSDPVFCYPSTYESCNLSPRLNLITLDFKNSLLKVVEEKVIGINEFPSEQIADLSEIKGLIKKRLPQQYWNKFSVSNLPFQMHGEGPILEHHLQAMLNVLSGASQLNIPEQYKRLLTAKENREFFEAFILFHDIAKISIKQKDIVEDGTVLSVYPNHERESVILLEQNPEWLSEFSESTKARLIKVIALHGAPYPISAQPVSAEKFIDFLKQYNISTNDVDNIMPYLIAADIIDFFGTYRSGVWPSLPLNFANGYESFKKQNSDYQEWLAENFYDIFHSEWLDERFPVLDKNGKEKEYVFKEYIDQVLSGTFEFPEYHQELISNISSLPTEDLWDQWVSVRDEGTLSNFSSLSEFFNFFTDQPYFLHYVFYVNLRELQNREDPKIIKQKYIFIEIFKRFVFFAQSLSKEKNQPEILTIEEDSREVINVISQGGKQESIEQIKINNYFQATESAI